MPLRDNNYYYCLDVRVTMFQIRRVLFEIHAEIFMDEMI